MTNEEIEIIKIVFQSYLNIVQIFKKPNYISEEVVTEVRDKLINELEQTRWIPCSERLPKENEYIKNVCKHYLIQDEYEDMHVAHLSNVGWIPMDSLKAIGDEIIAWQELPQSYKEEQDAKNNTDND